MRSEHILYWWDGSTWQNAVHDDYEVTNSFWYTYDYAGNKDLSYHNTGNLCNRNYHHAGYLDPDTHSATSVPSTSDTNTEWLFRDEVNGQESFAKHWYPFNAANKETTVYVSSDTLCD